MRTIIFAIFIASIAVSVNAQTKTQKFEYELTSNLKLQNSSYIETEVQKKKSAGVAVLYSLLLPGMGELYADGFDNGIYSLSAETVLWLTYIGFQSYGSMLQKDARLFAAVHAGAEISGKDEKYFVNIGNFLDAYEYNEKKLRDREIEKLYNVNAGYYWNWDSDANRKTYRAMRVSSDKVFNNGKFVIGAIVANHIFSAVNAARLVRRYNNNLAEKLESWRIESKLYSSSGALPNGISLSVIHIF